MRTATASRVQPDITDLFACSPTGVEDAFAGRGFDASSSLASSSARLRDRAFDRGIETLTDTEVLELYIARATPRGASAYAAALVARFGDLHAVLAADVAALSMVVERELALDLRLLFDLTRRSLEIPLRAREVLSSTTAVIAYLRFTMASRPRESVRVLWLDKRNRLIADEAIGEGTVDHAPVYPREVARRALETSAASCVLCHNHPSESTSPSNADVQITKQIIDCLKVFGIPVHDHFIVAGETVVSMKSLGLI
ncbi:DNA repair protein RadC [Caulobacter sp. 17J65-9]|uniref:JAB domain-containing protein n=1 Tax=Caulobacter sp. 17J65-9 TaxID=2709382 RepID=UPI0013C9688A|nr:DNA repair protein RadC [Caulobacter sp. 17J65-9]NEX91169.1 DNA repair protein RadC [Caulobacter sp. 17J65-9]